MTMSIGIQPQIEVKGLSKRFDGNSEQGSILALSDVDISVTIGEFVALLGPSGCGKSTLLNLIAGFEKATAGQILQAGVPITKPDRRRTVVFQEYGLFPWKTIQQNVEFGLKAKGIKARQRADMARHLLGVVRLEGFEDRYPHEISGGMKQRAAIARAVAPDPDVLLMDEPFGALDAQTRVLLQEEVARIAAETAKTIVFVTHSIDEAVFLADRILVMSTRPGRIQEIHKVDLPRPRLPEMRSNPLYRDLVETLWHSLRPQWQDAGSPPTLNAQPNGE